MLALLSAAVSGVVATGGLFLIVYGERKGRAADGILAGIVGGFLSLVVAMILAGQMPASALVGLVAAGALAAAQNRVSAKPAFALVGGWCLALGLAAASVWLG